MRFEKRIKIGNREISPDSPVFIIAEAGVNHGGNIAAALELVDVAVAAGADAVKFQAFKTEHLILKNVGKAPYQKETTGKDERQFDMLKKLELRREQNQEIQRYCEQKGIIFLSTPFDTQSLEELESLSISAYKVSSTDVTNLPFLIEVAKKGRPIILSTGMCYYSEIKAALQEIQPFNTHVILLQCTANYPIEDGEANLAVIKSYQREFDMLVGYSDHTIGSGAAPYAAAMGAKVVEKVELKTFVREVRKVEQYLGSPIKCPTVSELGTRRSLQKCLVAARDIAGGEILSRHNLTAKRTGGIGISPIYYRYFFGKKANKNYKKDEIIEIENS
jgi:sialic acid synthase SpsE